MRTLHLKVSMVFWLRFVNVFADFSAAFVSDHDAGFQNYGSFPKENRVRASFLARTPLKL